MRTGRLIRSLPIAAATVAVGVALYALATATTPAQAASDQRRCPRGIRACSASQVGQPCDPSNLNVLCTLQANGAYCCLAYAP
jgi:hypothetical protein